ncbi:trypsin-3-like isoform X2 [Dunckerocampus dactyliophorus]|uniref:trypsin-3-like isoform X2 n=1 Tax=Dunckerocampus dactyliophorus TaxID=161453 RepID=UPI002405FD08|nr:trypsin-3-like isoform X2 [Dunckerocampus dactyliophorus]
MVLLSDRFYCEACLRGVFLHLPSDDCGRVRTSEWRYKSSTTECRSTLDFLIKLNMDLCRCAFLLLVLLVPGGSGQLNECGVSVVNSRIVGGQDATPGAAPWQVSIHRNNFHTCGGSLINNLWVLSAAHCFPSPMITSNLLIYLGRQSQLGNNNDNEVERQVAEVIPHEDYSPVNNDNDVALVRLTEPVDFTDFIRPICLAAQDSDIPVGTDFIVTGWGTIASGVPLPFPQTLQEVSVPVVSNADCNEAYGIITSNMICAGLMEGGRDSCQGDSGGPMVSQSDTDSNETRHVQAGIVSFGEGCALAERPGVYARVSQYQTWISDRVTGPQPGFITFRASTTTSPPTSGVFLLAPLMLFLLPPVLTVLVLS